MYFSGRERIKRIDQIIMTHVERQEREYDTVYGMVWYGMVWYGMVW
jgi:hypothetical protein